MKILLISTLALMSFLSVAQEVEEKKEIDYRVKADCSITKNKENYGIHKIDLILREDSNIVASGQNRKTDFHSKYIKTPLVITALVRTDEEFDDMDEFVFSVKNHDNIVHSLNTSLIEHVIDNELDQTFIFPLDNGYNYNCRFFYYD